MAKTISQLLALANTIYNETVAKQNSANRIGGTLLDMVDYMEQSEIKTNSKINSIKETAEVVITEDGRKMLTFTRGAVQPADIPEIEFDSETSMVSLSTKEIASIYYTTDGSVPSVSSYKYLSPFEIGNQAIVKSISDNGSAKSNVPQITATIVIEGPDVSLSLSSSNSGVIRYTTDGTNPTSNSTEFTSNIALSTGQTIMAALFNGTSLNSKISTIQTV